MQRYIIRRVTFMIPTILAMMIGVFALVRIMPGDYIMAQMAEARGTPNEAQLALWRAELGLDDPAHIQFVEWFGGVLTGDWGTSFWQNAPVLDVVADRLPVSAELGILAIALALVISVPIGVLSAVFQDKPIDYAGRSFSIGLLSLPNFFFAILIIIFGARWFNWLPPQTYRPLFEDPWGNFQQFVPAAVVLGTSLSAQNMRMIRTTMLETMRADYVRTARAKGLRERQVIFRHAFRNALIPVVTLLGFQIALVIGGSVIVETVFAMNGIGFTYVGAINQRDYPLVQGILLILVTVTLITNLLVDLSYSWLDPRIRY